MELILQADNLSCGYAGKPILKNLNFSVTPGEVLCILGPNGVGKTTLFRTILGLLPAIDGAVTIAGMRVNHNSVHKTAGRAAYVPQAHFPAFPYTVRDIVVMGRTSRMRAFAVPGSDDYRAAEAVLERLELSSLAEKSYTEISGGERQMVLIARALVQRPQVLVMDEPAASLDYGNQARLLRQICALAAEGLMGIVMTSHNPEHAFLAATQVMLILPDKTVLQGPTATILTEENLSSAYSTRIRILREQRADGGLLSSCSLDL